ncbi:Mth938-like domain-containing protein [Oceaniglobus trochenteri]|uniref:Mth938-like domain-containing protein n=1 Tax=Oceaniglobus trochenteri TaxID=2763260 RepID=UPI001CFFBAF3|nr:Mth938-like domain-containing protein [Oceaniglobus trochenteri]
MRLNEISYNDSRPIDGYGPGFFRIGGKVVQGDVCVLPGGVLPWGGYVDHATLIQARDDLDVVFVGTGAEVAHVPGDFRAALEEAGLGVEAMATPAACRTYNILLSEGRRVGVALLAV